MPLHHHLKKIMYSKNNSSQEKPKFYNGHRNRKNHDELKISNEDFNQKLNDQNQINILDIGFGSGESIVSQDFKQCNIFGIESYLRGIVKMNKYKNQEGISLNYTGKDSHQVLVREVVREAVKILSTYRVDSPESMGWAIQECKEFLRVNFNIKDSGRSDEWIVEQYNRNRSVEDQVSTVEEIEEEVRKWVNEIPNS